eukprot:COSAG01_NODE_7992_length_2961_cov_69.700210_5_plen_82_part_00
MHTTVSGKQFCSEHSKHASELGNRHGSAHRCSVHSPMLDQQPAHGRCSPTWVTMQLAAHSTGSGLTTQPRRHPWIWPCKVE